MRIDVARKVAAPRQIVWDVLTDWERQPEWMLDAKSVEVLTPHREGEGVTVRVPTNLLGVTVEDVMRVTGWVDGSYLEVTHLGRIITGSGAFELSDGPRQPTGPTTILRWWEEIEPPLGRVGEWGASRLVAPIISRIFARSLRQLGDLAEREAAASDGHTP